MKRYISLYLKLIKLNFSELLVYRTNFYNSIVSSVLWSFFLIVSMLLLTSKTGTVYGWTRGELLLVVASYNLVVGVFYCLFSKNFGELSRLIHYGELDSILLKPFDSQFYVSLWKINYANLSRVITGSIFIAIIVYSFHIMVSFENTIAYIFFLLLGMGIMYSIWFIILTLLIWFSRLTNLIDLLYTINGISRYPGEFFSKVKEVLLFLVFPFTLILAEPVKVLINKSSFFGVISIILCFVLLFGISRIFWRFSLRFYTSANG